MIAAEPEQFYYLARATFVHDESQLDRFDRVFAEVFKGLVGGGEEIGAEVPEEWLRLVAEAYLIQSQGMYRLGPSMFRLASGVLNAWYLPHLVRQLQETGA